MQTISKIDITMTSVLRPGIVNETLESFCNNLFTEKSRYRLVINIDPVGEKVKAKEVVKVCQKYFDDVVYNIPNKPSFPAAVIWTWKNSRSDWVFHLEDDWKINSKVDINHMISILNKYKDVACLRMSKHPLPRRKIIKLFRSNYSFKPEGFFIGQDRKAQFGLNPVLIRGKFIKRALPYMVTTKNPEKQFRYGNELLRDFIMKWRYAIYGRPGQGALVVDNGSKWRKDFGFDKPDPEEGPFLVWKKK